MKKVMTIVLTLSILLSVSCIFTSCAGKEDEKCTVTFDYNDNLCFEYGLPEIKTRSSSYKNKDISVSKGDYIKAPPTPSSSLTMFNKSYVFGGWYKEPSCENAFDFNSETVNTDFTLYAKWILITHDINYD